MAIEYIKKRPRHDQWAAREEAAGGAENGSKRAPRGGRAGLPAAPAGTPPRRPEPCGIRPRAAPACPTRAGGNASHLMM